MKLKPMRITAATCARACVALLFCSQCVSGQQARAEIAPPGPNARTIYVIQEYFHTGIIIELDREARGLLEFEPYFTGYRCADIGWGDEVFYQDPEFSLYNAMRAILWPTSSVVRIEGFDQKIEDVLAWSDRAMKITITGRQFRRLCSFINSSLTKTADGKLVTDSVHGGGSVMFFKSPYGYDLFNTCNTWVAKGFNFAGLSVSPCCVVTAGTLFCRLKKIGEFIKK